MLDGDPLTDPIAATGAVRDFRRHLKNGRRAPNTIDTYLSAIDDFHARRGLGKPQARRERDSRRTAPRTLDERRARRYVRHVQLTATPRDKALALLPYFAGLRIAEVVVLDLADIRLSACKGELRIRGKGRDGGGLEDGGGVGLLLGHLAAPCRTIGREPQAVAAICVCYCVRACVSKTFSNRWMTPSSRN
ncbi:hypothetical protein GCM10010404_61480 [Nonomuraea africana]|uniref:Integrase n=1 Tax=Nonomuraea africana TaxID=46171 RepID=A0ABR9K6H3_9ACTN|nr:hypothetical protein [Nonomuraea africana]MBE1557616.1 integrase [Nonomuraea africana]